MSPLHPLDKAGQQRALDELQKLCDIDASDRSAIPYEVFLALRAAASHAGQEVAARLGLKWEGEQPCNHDDLMWLDMLTYTSDPF